MLSSMRTKGGNVFAWLLIGGLIIGLTGFTLGGLGGGTLRTIGTVGNEQIPIDTYVRAIQINIQNIESQIGRRITPSEAQNFGVYQSSLESVLATTAISNEANRLGISVGDEAIFADIMSTPSFRGLDGAFDQETYEDVLRRSNLPPIEYENSLRTSSAQSIIQGSVLSGIATSGITADTLLEFAFETRGFEWTRVGPYLLETGTPPADDTQIQAFYNANPDGYMTPLTRKVTYVWLNPDQVADQVDVSEDDLLGAYESQSDRFNRPASVIVDRLIFSTTDAAEQARSRVDASVITFDDLVRERGLDPSDVALGSVERGALSTAAADLLFAQTETGLVGPVESSLGPALYRINAIQAAQNTSFEDARDDLIGEQSTASARFLVSEEIVAIDDLLAAGATLEELAQDTDMTMGQIDLTAATTTDIAAYDEFRQAANAASVGDFPELVRLTDGGVFALRLDDVIEPALRPLADVKDDVAANWRKSETTSRLIEVAKVLVPKLTSDTAFGDLNLLPKTESGIQRTAFIEGTPPILVTDIFATNVGDVILVEDVDGAILARVVTITEIDKSSENVANARTNLTAQIDQQIATDALSLFTTAVQEQAGVGLDQEAIRLVNSQVVTGYGG